MKSETKLTNLLSELSTDLGDPNFVWQSASLFFCFLLAWAVSHHVKKYFTTVDHRSGVLKIGVESFSRVLLPLLSLVFILIVRMILSRWQHTALLSIFIPIIGSFALIRFSFYVFRRVFVKDGTIGTGLWLFEKLFAAFVWIGVVLHFTGLWGELIVGMNEIVLPGPNKVSLLDVIQALISVALTVMVALWISAMIEVRLMKLPNMHSSLKVVLSRSGKAFFILIAILISLSLVGIDLTVLSVFGGALGVGLGFGLQKIASNYISGFIILLDRSMSIGDMLMVDKYAGVITQINARYSVLRGLDGVETLIPNELLISSPIQNLSFTDKEIAIITEVSVAYQTDIEKLLPLIADAIVELDRVSKINLPTAYLMRFGADGFDLRVSFWIADPENGRSNITSEVNRTIWRVLQEQNVEIPYPQREVRFLNSPAT
jgi:small-conductance mechanosensitive channel